MHQKAFLFVAALFFIMQGVVADEDESSIKITPSGFAYYQIGQIQHMTPEDPTVIKAFDQHFNGRLTLDAAIQEKLRIIMGRKDN
jgi:hypothetical protein